jgi:hypothetical protein
MNTKRIKLLDHVRTRMSGTNALAIFFPVIRENDKCAVCNAQASTTFAGLCKPCFSEAEKIHQEEI